MTSNELVRYYRGDSMSGSFKPGDCLFYAEIDLKELAPGQVVIFRLHDPDDKDKEVVHRVISLTPNGLITRGDHNHHIDPDLLTADNLVGLVTHFERNGITRQVGGGFCGLQHARCCHTRLKLWRCIKNLGRRPYTWLRNSALIKHLWRPSIIKVRVKSEDGPLVKYVFRGRTVAQWWPELKRWECDHPFDLVISRPEMS